MNSVRNAIATPMMAQRMGAGSARASEARVGLRRLIDAVLNAPVLDG